MLANTISVSVPARVISASAVYLRVIYLLPYSEKREPIKKLKPLGCGILIEFIASETVMRVEVSATSGVESISAVIVLTVLFLPAVKASEMSTIEWLGIELSPQYMT
jgi:hypothetical protein